MSFVNSFIFPDIPPDLREILFKEDKTRIIIGVIGKSSNMDCNKMAGLQVLQSYPSLLSNRHPKEGAITFYFEKDSNSLFIHFETSYDVYVMYDMLTEWDNNTNEIDNHSIKFNSYIRQSFGRMLLFAIQVSHLIILVETGNTFDSSYLSLFKALKLIREKYVLKFLPKILENSNVGSFMGKEGRMCSPRFLFFFEKCVKTNDDNFDDLDKIEFELEDDIYKMLRNEFIITNNSSMSLFSIPCNKRFVYINTDTHIRDDPLIDSMNNLDEFIEKSSIPNNHNTNDKIDDDLDDLRPFKGFGVPWSSDKKEDIVTDKKLNRCISNLINDHVTEALQIGFDDSMSKFRGKSHFVKPTTKAWYDSFTLLHKIFIENPDNPNFEAKNADYKAYLENFNKIVDIDERFFMECCQHGLERAITSYNELMPHHYNSTVHESNLLQTLQVFKKYARGPHTAEYEAKLRDTCETNWKSGKQQCEYPSLRGNSCILLKHIVTDITEHSSGVMYVSACNCGRTKGHREDPYTIKQANYEFYQIIGKSCSACNKIEKVVFPVFQPSINDFRPAPMVSGRNSMSRETCSPHWSSENHPPDFLMTPVSQQNDASQNSLTYPSLECLANMMKICDKNDSHLPNDPNEKPNSYGNDEKEEDFPENEDENYDENSINEIVIKVGDVVVDKDKSILRLASTTEYFPGMVHTLSPDGLLPQFPSWSLVCIGPSSVYSHNTGLPEHVQSGFLTGANFLLPWDVQIRLEHAAEWAASYEKHRNRKKVSSKASHVLSSTNPDSVFNLKIFVGNEYECRRGHRFIMSAPDKVLRGGGSSGLVRESGSKVVFNDMPLYFPCPCRSTNPSIAQLMRVHVVTPKAPVNVMLDPKVRCGEKKKVVFVTGFSEPIKLSQSAYWILRLPFAYQGDDEPFLPPLEVSPSSALGHGCLLAGMYGISETEKNL